MSTKKSEAEVRSATIEEFTEACWLFTYADPDGNGKNDTFGFAPGSKSIWWNPIYHAFGVSVDFDYNEETGNVEYFRLTDKFNTFLKYANFLYNLQNFQLVPNQNFRCQ